MRPEKTTIVEDLSARLNASPFLIVTEYTGMNVSEFAELRHRLARAGAECKVVKNTFLRRAAAEVGFPDLGESLGGQTAIVTGESDVCAAAKILKTFSTEFQRPSVKVGASEDSSGISVAGPTGTQNTWITLTADGVSSSIVVKSEDGSEQIIQP